MISKGPKWRSGNGFEKPARCMGLTIYRVDTASSAKHGDSTGLISLPCTSLCDPRAHTGNLLKEFLIIKRSWHFTWLNWNPASFSDGLGFTGKHFSRAKGCRASFCRMILMWVCLGLQPGQHPRNCAVHIGQCSGCPWEHLLWTWAGANHLPGTAWWIHRHLFSSYGPVFFGVREPHIEQCSTLKHPGEPLETAHLENNNSL